MQVYPKMYNVLNRENKLADSWRRDQGDKHVAGIE